MAWKSVIGQERIKDIFQRAIAENKISHAYCLWGIDGIGKDALALEFAKTVNCQNPKITENGIEACDECRSCKTANSLQNPSIQLLYSLPTPKSPAGDDSVMGKMTDEQLKEIKEQIALKAENPYHKITLAGANQIKIASVRELKKNLSLSSSGRGRRFIIISHADELTTEAANAFLKTLEEPQNNITIIMTTAKHEQILQTIMSRSQQIHCEPIADEELIVALNKRHCIPRDEGRLIAVFAQGSYLAALEYLDADMKAFREKIVTLFRISLKKNYYRKDLYDELQPIFVSKDKKRIEKLLLLLMTWIRDAMLIACGSPNELIMNIDQEDSLRSFARNFQTCDFPRALGYIEEAIAKIKKNTAVELIMLDLIMKLREVFLAKK